MPDLSRPFSWLDAGYDYDTAGNIVGFGGVPAGTRQPYFGKLPGESIGVKLDSMVSADWTTSSCTKTQDSGYTRTGNSALKITPTAATCYVQRDVQWPAVPQNAASLGQPYHVVVYCQNLNKTADGHSTDTFIRLRLWSGAGATGTNDMHYDWNQNNLREGWNDLTIHPNEDGNYTYAAANTWSVNAGSQAGLIAAPVLTARLEFRNCQGDNNPVFYVGAIYQGGKANPYITLGFDQYGTDVTNYALPAMEAAGMKGYIALIGAQAVIDAGGANLARLDLLYNTYGWDILNHGTTHTNLVGMTGPQMIAEVEPNRDAIASRWPRGANIFVTPNNGINPTVAAYLESIGTLWCRNGVSNRRNTASSIIGLDRPVWLGGEVIDNPFSAARMQLALRSAIRYGETIHMYGHAIVTSAAAGSVLVTDFQSLCMDFENLRAAGQIECLSPSEWYTRTLLQPTAA